MSSVKDGHLHFYVALCIYTQEVYPVASELSFPRVIWFGNGRHARAQRQVGKRSFVLLVSIQWLKGGGAGNRSG